MDNGEGEGGPRVEDGFQEKIIPWKKDVAQRKNVFHGENVAQGRNVSPKVESARGKNEPKVEDGH